MGWWIGRDGLIGLGIIAKERDVWKCGLEEWRRHEDTEGVDCNSLLHWILVYIQLNATKARDHGEHT